MRRAYLGVLCVDGRIILNEGKGIGSESFDCICPDQDDGCWQTR